MGSADEPEAMRAWQAPGRYSCAPPMLARASIAPARKHRLEGPAWHFDFGRAMFGTIEFRATCTTSGTPLRLHLGEKALASGAIDRNPPGTVRYRPMALTLKAGTHLYRVAIPADERNTGPGAIPMPAQFGEVLPFRYCEFEPGPYELDDEYVRQLAVHVPFDDEASAFECSDRTLNDVWELCRHTVKATTFCGLYVDGDRERIPYEGDAYINQLSHYACDAAYQIGRYTHEYLVQHPTWFADWNLHSVFMAWADYLYTGDAASLALFYDDLKVKTLIELARPDGLISTQSESRPPDLERRLHLFHARYIERDALRDLVDWPPGSFSSDGQGERDGHDMRPINTVLNALHYRALVLMARIATVLNATEDADRFGRQAQRVREAINATLFEAARGIYVDGEGSDHASLHSNMMLLAFDVVPMDRRHTVIEFVKSRGMACSVYGAQYLLDALYANSEANYALELMTSTGDRGWWHMLEQGGTMTWEAWDFKYKQNLDWNHAWGTAPLNVVARRLMGIQPAEPGFGRISLWPQPGWLEHASIRVPTIRGAIQAEYQAAPSRDGRARYQITVPRKVGVAIHPAVAKRIRIEVLHARH